MTRALALAVLLAVPATAHAGWASLGAMPAPRREPHGLVFRNEQATVAITVLAPDVVRVRFTPGAPGRDHSYAVVTRELGDATARVDVGAEASSIATAELRVTIRHAPFRLAFADAAGNSLDEDDSERGMAWAGKEVRVWKRLREDEHVYGLGEKSGRLDKRGWKLGGYSYAMWNSDTYGYDDSTDPLYASVPFYMVLRNGRAHGVFLDNTFRSTFDVGKESQELLSFGAAGGALDYYFFAGPTPRRIVESYTKLTGRMPLPPLWSLGFHQCRYSYYPEARVREVASEFRRRRIPADALWLDIHYQQGYKPFSWDKQRFPDPAKMIADLAVQGFRTITIVDPHPKKEPGSVVYDTGLAGGHFVKNPDGTVYEAPVWPSQAERDPGPSVFADFSRPATREWWGGLYRPLLDIGVGGIWNDMNEPAVFDNATGTMPLGVRHDNEGEPTDHREIHNVYGMQMTRATYEGLLRLRPDERPFVLSRASFAGGQRYAALWPGDNSSDWSHLRASIPVLAGMGLSGLAFVGADIGGFAKNGDHQMPSAELFTRWLEAGVFYPFMRDHSELGSADQEPWAYGPEHEAINRRMIELRYELLPSIYNVMHEAAETGVPALRPLVFEYPEDPRFAGRDDEYLFGSDILVAPVVREAAVEREVSLPKGDWYDFWTGARQTSADFVRPAPLDVLPLYVRGGAFLFREPVVQHTGERAGQPLIVEIYPAERSQATLYEDDGESLAYRRGVVRRVRFAQTRAAASATVAVGAAEGAWVPAPRELVLRVHWDGDPGDVRLDGKAVARNAWTRRGAFVEVRLPDDGAAHELRLAASGA